MEIYYYCGLFLGERGKGEGGRGEGEGGGAL
jgi:hypothetical protein